MIEKLDVQSISSMMAPDGWHIRAIETIVNKQNEIIDKLNELDRNKFDPRMLPGALP